MRSRAIVLDTIAPTPTGTQAHRDIDDMVSWGIDHLKVDGCHEFDHLHMNGSYAIVGGFLEAASVSSFRSDAVESVCSFSSLPNTNIDGE